MAPGSSALISKSLDFPPCSSTPTSSATPSMFPKDNSSTIRVLTMPPPCIPTIVVQSEHLHTIPSISDYDAEKRGRVFLKKTAKVRQPSRSDANTMVREDPKTLVFLAAPGAFPALKRKKRATPRQTCTSRTDTIPSLDLVPVSTVSCPVQ
ncbi:hypothetical protein JB92DRAFT_3106278 [Gautieria morchelliformis]|nr:hypothetical protein JB92DRAFT_3106278 [Gautieria morchelliformis]